MGRWHLFWHFFVSAALVVVLLLVLLERQHALKLNEARNAAAQASLEIQAILFAELIQPLLSQGDTVAAQALCASLQQQTGHVFMVIFPDRRVLGGKQSESVPDSVLDAVVVRRAWNGSAGFGMQRAPQFSIPVATVPLFVGRRIAAVARVAGVPVFRETHGFSMEEIGLGLAGLCTLALVLFRTSRSFSRSLQDLASETERFASGDLKQRVAAPESVELSTLAEGMNHMARMLDERIQSILQQRNEQEAVLTSMVEGVLAVDSAGTIINLNQAGAELLGVDANSVKNRTIHEVVRKTDLLKFVEQSLGSTTGVPIEDDILLLGDHQDRYLNAHGTPLHDANGRSIGALIVFHDVTKLRQLENVRRDFVANVSHELRTPITSIKGFVETLLDGAIDDPETAERFLHIILKQADRLNSIISDLLSLSRIERDSGQETIELACGPILPVLQSAAQMCETQAAYKEITIQLECEADLRAHINARLLEQAIVNLVDNAIKYSASGSSVRICVEESDLTVTIRVIDKGCGIAASHLPRLFERFYRVDKARSRELGGTGLGLSIVKHIALAHQGSIEVDSQLGRGSEFRLLLCACSCPTHDNNR